MTGIRRKIVIAGVTALVLTAGASAATAAVMSSGPVDSSGVIHGCWSNAALNGSHAFVLQDAGSSCPKGTTAISWNMQGPQGPAGPEGSAGPAGVAGPAGPTGPAGSSDIDGGTIIYTPGFPGTCTVSSSFGPDTVTISYDYIFGSPEQYGGCEISGLPANADVQATPMLAGESDPLGGWTYGSALSLYPQGSGSTLVLYTSPSGATGVSSGAAGEFSWIAVPSS